MERIVANVGAWLGTIYGFWFNIFMVIASAPLALVSIDISTWILSVTAIVLPAFILKRDHDRDKVAEHRDVAMHAKLDALVAAMPGAPNDLVGVEEK